MPWPAPLDYYVQDQSDDHVIMCYKANVTQSNSLWRAANPVTLTLPVFALQLSLIIFLSRFFAFILKPLRLPPIVAQILAGTLLGPTGVFTYISKGVITYKSLLPLDTVANLSLVYYVFLVGLELEMSPIIRANVKSISIAGLGIALPMSVGIGLHHIVNNCREKFTINQENRHGPLFWGISLAATNFTDLSRILSDMKLLHSEMGRTALSASIITDLCSWVLFVITLSTSHEGKFYSVLSTTTFAFVCLFLFRPAVKWIIENSSKDGNYDEFHTCFIMTGAVACGLVTDACGSHSIVGAFLWGVIMPKGDLKDMILARIEDLVKLILIPTFFISIGVRVNLKTVGREIDWVLVSMVIFIASSAKIISTFLVAIFCNMPPREGLAIGSLMNSKGLLALIIINAGRDLKALDHVTFSIMLLCFWVMTALIGPTLALTYSSFRSLRQHKYKTIQSLKHDSEFRVIACVHSTRNVSGIIHLLKVSNPISQSPLVVFALHLIELIGRSTAMLIVHGQCNISSGKAKVQNDHIINAFDDFESESDGTTVHSLTAVSPYTTMHDDICGMAAEKHVHLIIIPFHKRFTMDGAKEEGNPSVGIVNNNVITHSPCSVAILIDRGLSTSCVNYSSHLQQCFAIFFFGGPDDREALAYACRMSEHPDITITIVRFLPGDDVKDVKTADSQDEENFEIFTASSIAENEKLLDNDYLQLMQAQFSNNESLSYKEVVVNNGDETMKVISTLENEYNMYIVGRGRGMMSPLVSGLSEWSENPELGVLGDALVTSSFTKNISILVVQKGDMDVDERAEKFNDIGFIREQFGHTTWQPSMKKLDNDF